MKYALIHRHEGQHAVALMCRVLTLSRSGYYDWRGRPPSDRAKANVRLAADVHRVYAQNKGRTGAPRITKHLRDEGQKVGQNRVARVMRTEQLRAKAARKYKATTNSNHGLPVAPNLLEQDFTATTPNQKWVSDITYIATDEGWLYLAVVLDLYSRLVVGWAMAERTATGSGLAQSHKNILSQGINSESVGEEAVSFYSGQKYSSHRFYASLDFRGNLSG